MHFVQKMVATLSLCLVAAAVVANPANPQNGVDYRTLDRAQPTEAGKKVEVTEFFWYSCPHCNAFEPYLSEWVKKQGDNIVFKRVPVNFRESFVPQQRLYYTLEAMGKSEEMQKKIFNAIHVEHQPLDDEKAIIDFVVKQGFDRQKFTDLYNSFAVQTKVSRATQLQMAYRIDGVPTIAVDGRYLTSPSIVGANAGNQSEAVLHETTLKVMDALVVKAGKERHAAADVKPSVATRAVASKKI